VLAQKGGPGSPSGEQAALLEGQKALEKGDLASARTEFEKAVRLAPRDATAQSALGWVLAKSGEADEALRHLQTALNIKPSLIEARLTLAGVLAQQGKTIEGEQQARAAVKMAPENAEVHRTLARILSQHSGEEALSEMQGSGTGSPSGGPVR